MIQTGGAVGLAFRLLTGLGAALLSAACAGQSLIPDRRISGGAANSDPTPLLQEAMASSATPERSFHIDRYETAEIAPGVYLAAPAQTPVVNVTREEAAQRCASAGKRLCTLDEWVSACLGVQQRRFSYGFQATTGRCNLGGGGVALTGEYAQCKSDTDVYDLIGNVMEWVADSRGATAIAVGGSYSATLETDCFSRSFLPPETRQPQIGFRCCN